MSFIFGGDTGMTYGDVQRKRELAERLIASQGNAPRNVGEGLTAIGNALAARSLNKQASKAVQANPEFANLDGLRDVAGKNPSAAVIEALMKGVPNYARGGVHFGGQAVVGENGPEVVQLPRGAQIMPVGGTFQPGQDPDDAVEGYMEPLEADEYLRNELGDGVFQNYQGMSREQQLDFLNDPNNGFVPPPPDDLRNLIPVQDARFDDAAAYQTAESGQIATDALPYGDAKLTEGQSKDVGFFRRGLLSDKTLNDPKMEQALLQYTDTFAGNFGSIGRQFQDADFQVAKRAADEFLAAILRKDTGAAITSEEFKLYGPMYLPMPGDKPELLAAKREARASILKGLHMGLGTAAPLGKMIQDELGGNAAPDVGAMSDEDLMKALTGGS